MHTVGEAPSSVPAFLGKLWKLVEDPATNHLISWNPNGLSFTIRDQARFARELLPLYYKHNNMASFVRQLNMYGFHKVVSVDSGGLKVDKDEMEFAHMYFLQGQEYLLEHIKRKIPVSKQDDSKHNKPEVLSRVLAEVRSMKGKQENVDSRLATMKRENEALWREVASLRQKHMKQQQIVNKLIQFLISIVQPNGHAGLGHNKRRYPLMLRARSNSKSSEDKNSSRKDKESRLKVSSDGPIIHDVTDLEDEAAVELDISNGNEDQDEILEAKDVIDDSTVNPDTLAPADILDTVSAADDRTTAIDESLEEELNAVQPDLDTVAQLEAGTSNPGTGIVDRAMMASPLSPDLMMAVDPREVNSGALLSFEESRKGTETETGRGKSVAKKQENAIVVTEIPRLDNRDEFDNHLDSMQMDLEQLREVLSLQGTPIDASTLLGVCNLIDLNLEMGVDSPNWPADNTAAARNRRNLPSDTSTSQLFNNLLEQQLLAKLFSADDQLASSLLPFDMDLFRSPNQGAITGNEVIAFNNSPFFDGGNDDGSQFLEQGDALLKAEPGDEKDSPDLFDLLSETPVATPATGPSAAKKKKRN